MSQMGAADTPLSEWDRPSASSHIYNLPSASASALLQLKARLPWRPEAGGGAKLLGLN